MDKGSTRETGSSGLGLLVLGACIGAGLALLLAPSPGPENRDRLGHWLHGRRDSGHALFLKLRKMLTFRHNGHQVVDGRSSAVRRHKRGFGA